MMKYSCTIELDGPQDKSVSGRGGGGGGGRHQQGSSHHIQSIINQSINQFISTI